MSTSKQLLFIESEDIATAASFEVLYSTGTLLESNYGIRIHEDQPTVDNFTLEINGHVIADKYKGRSDARLKTDVVPIENSLDIINKMNGVSYRMNKDTKNSYGFIAQDVQKIVPEIVETDPNGYMTISYIEIIPFLVESIKQLKQEIKILKQEKRVI